MSDSESCEESADTYGPSTSKTVSVLRKSKSKSYSQRFRRKWKQSRSWLKESTKGELFFTCTLCKKDYTAGLSEIQKHEKGQSHIKKCKSIINQPTLSVFSQQNIKLNQSVQAAEIRISSFIAEHNLSFRISDHLTQLIKSVSPDSKITPNITCGRTKCSNLIKNVTGNVMNQKLVTFLQKTSFSLIIDESTDKSAIKHLCLLVRLNINGKFQDHFLSLLPLEDATSLNIYNKITEYFVAKKIDYKKNMIGFAADGANAMMGRHNSVSTLFQNDIPNLFVQKCICHSFALCASYATRKILNNVEEFTRELFKYFQYSFKKTSEFLKFQEFANIQPHKLLHPSQTRWLSLHQVVSRILEQWNALRLFFIDAVVHDNLESTEILLKKLHDPEIKIYLEFLDYILPFFNELNREMQSEHPKIHLLHTKISATTRSLMDMYIKRDYLDKMTEINQIEFKNPSHFLKLEDIYLGGRVSASLLDSNELRPAQVENIRKNCLYFLVEAVGQIFQRFDFKRKDYRLMEIIIPENIKNKKHASIVPLAMELKLSGIVENMYNDLDREWRTLRNYNLDSVGNDSEAFWDYVSKIKTGEGNLAFPLLINLVGHIFTLPHSSANVERVFSSLNIIKTKNRNKLKTDALIGLLHTKRMFSKNIYCYNCEIDNSFFAKMGTKTSYEKDSSSDESD